MSIDQIYQAIRALPVGEQLRLVQRVVHDVAVDKATGEQPDILGLFADDPELIEKICAEALAERNTRQWRTGT